MRAVVRGGGSIGTRHVEVLHSLGMSVDLWPVRPRPTGSPGHFPGGDEQARSLYAAADLVVIATDTTRHAADALEALEHGARRVLVEKPVGPTAADAAALAAHPRASVVAVAAPLRAHEGFSAVTRAVSALPGPLSAAVHCQSWLPGWRPGTDFRQSYSARPSEGGVLRDLVHEIDYACVLFGEPRLVGAVLEHDGPLDIASDQAASLLWTTERATVATRLDYISRPGSRGVVVRSAAGSVEWDVLTATVTTVDAGGGRESTVYEGDRDRNTVLARQAAALLGRRDTGAPATLAEGVAVVGLCDEARAADAQRRRDVEDACG